jgi:hypothetical protein
MERTIVDRKLLAFDLCLFLDTYRFSRTLGSRLAARISANVVHRTNKMVVTRTHPKTMG